MSESVPDWIREMEPIADQEAAKRRILELEALDEAEDLTWLASQVNSIGTGPGDEE